jgi:hypothetical protein
METIKITIEATNLPKYSVDELVEYLSLMQICNGEECVKVNVERDTYKLDEHLFLKLQDFYNYNYKETNPIDEIVKYPRNRF